MSKPGADKVADPTVGSSPTHIANPELRKEA